MGLYTARNRQRTSPFAALSRQKAAAKKQAKKGAAPPEPEAAPEPEPAAVPFDRNPESEEYEQAPDISTYAAGGVVPVTTVEETVIAEHGPEHVVPLGLISNDTRAAVQAFQRPAEISPETRAKIDAVMDRAIPPVADEQPAETPAADPENDAKRGRGRPRPQETIARDNAVHALLVGADPESGISKESIAAELDEKEQQVYSSLRQLTKEGRAETRYVKPHGYRWFAV